MDTRTSRYYSSSRIHLISTTDSLNNKIGYGKSHDARKRLGGKFYAKIAANKWWDKYKGEDNVLIEDFDIAHAYQIHNLKIWADIYAFPVEIKYGNDLIRPKMIIVTSNYAIRDIWPDPVQYEPLERRFKQIHKSVPWNATIDGVLKTKKVKAVTPLAHKTPKKVKPNHMPLKKPALYKQNAQGDLVPNKQSQMIIDDYPNISKNPKVLKVTQEIPKEKDVIELLSSSSELSEECTGCTDYNCICNHPYWTKEDWIKYKKLPVPDDEIEVNEKYHCSMCGEHVSICVCNESEDDSNLISDSSESNATSSDDY